jgi:hypothetical protein
MSEPVANRCAERHAGGMDRRNSWRSALAFGLIFGLLLAFSTSDGESWPITVLNAVVVGTIGALVCKGVNALAVRLRE